MLHRSKCTKMHNFQCKLSKFSRGVTPPNPHYGRAVEGDPLPNPPPRTTSGAARLRPSGGRGAADCLDPDLGKFRAILWNLPTPMEIGQRCVAGVLREWRSFTNRDSSRSNRHIGGVFQASKKWKIFYLKPKRRQPHN